MKINDCLYRVIDSESTGLDPSTAGVVEVAYADLASDGEVVNRYESLFNPHHSIPPTASAVHHITDDMVIGLPHWGREAHLHEYGLYVAHNAPYDRELLYPHSAALWIDTERLVKHLRDDLPGYGNEVIRYALKLDVDLPPNSASHRAAHDVAVTAAIFKWCLVQVREQWPLIETVEQLVERIDRPCKLKMVPFKEQIALGHTFQDVEDSLLHWTIRKQAGGPDVVYSAKCELSRRYPPRQAPVVGFEAWGAP